MTSFFDISRYKSHARALMMRCLLLSLLLASPPLLAADFDKGVRAAEVGDYYATAFTEWRLLAEQGHVWAQYNLGWMYSNGKGVSQDYALAVKWYRRAAEQGDAEAQYNLGLMYGLGHGVQQDDVLAHMWGNLARAQGVENADELLKILETDMSRQQIATAQAMARQCHAQDYKNCDQL